MERAVLSRTEQAVVAVIVVQFERAYWYEKEPEELVDDGDLAGEKVVMDRESVFPEQAWEVKKSLQKLSSPAGRCPEEKRAQSRR